MSKLIGEISVFFPAFNEEGNIEKTVRTAKDVLLKVAGGWEIIVVDDGSKDRTREIAEKLAQNINRKLPQGCEIKVISQENKGYGGAVTTGFYNSKYEWIAFTDSDGQLDFSEISNFIAKQKERNADVVIGYRIDRSDPMIRKVFGWGWTLLANVFFGIGVRDVDCAFKLVRKEVIDKIPKLESMRGGMISPELLAKAKKAHFKIVEVPVHHFPRGSGEQTGANIRVIFKSFMDLFKLWRKLNLG